MDMRGHTNANMCPYMNVLVYVWVCVDIFMHKHMCEHVLAYMLTKICLLWHMSIHTLANIYTWTQAFT